MQTKPKSEKQTLVEDGTEFNGTMKSSCPVVVRGSFDGELKAPALTVTSTGTMTGKVDAENIRSEGVLAGTVDAGDVYLSGTVRSDTVIRAKTLEVKLAPDRGKLEVTFGEIVLDVGDEPEADDVEADEDGPRASEGDGNGKAEDMRLDGDAGDDDDDPSPPGPNGKAAPAPGPAE